MSPQATQHVQNSSINWPKCENTLGQHGQWIQHVNVICN